MRAFVHPKFAAFACHNRAMAHDKYDATVLRWAEFFGREDFATLVRERGGTM